MYEMTNEAAEFARLRDELMARGVKLEIAPGEYRISPLRGCSEAAFYADDLAEARQIGLALAEEIAKPTPPVGPCGRRNTRRAEILRHNTKLMNAGFWRRGGL